MRQRVHLCLIPEEFALREKQREIPEQELQLGSELGIPSWNYLAGRCHILEIMLGWIPACLKVLLGGRARN